MFDFSALRRFPDVEASNLQAWDATDELLVEWALGAAVPGDQIAVIGDEYGAITLALADAGLRGIRVHQDLVTGRRALKNNAEAMGLSGWTSHELDEALLTGARLVLVQLPKSLAALEEISDAVARWAASDVVLVAGGRVKHMTLAQNEVLARYLAAVQPQRAARKSRLLVASDPRAAAGAVPAPESSVHTVAGLEFVLCAYGGAFAGAKLDIGTRALLDAMPALAAGSRAADSPAAGSPAAGSPAAGSPAAGSPAADSPAAARSQLRKNPSHSGQTPRSDGRSPQFSGVVNGGPRVIDPGSPAAGSRAAGSRAAGSRAAGSRAAERSQLRKNPSHSGQTPRSDGRSPQFSGVVNGGPRVIDPGSPAADTPAEACSQLRKNLSQSAETPRSDGLSPQFSGVVNSGPRVIDLGCGTGALAVAFALQHPTATVTATDRSAAAVRSARATVDANHLEGRITVTLDDAGSDLDDASADLILLNPPFHLGASVHEGAGQRLIQAAARLTREGGEVWTVFNSHLDHRRALTREVGPTEQIARTPKFTVTRSIKRA